jgi:hypothetical protein
MTIREVRKRLVKVMNALIDDGKKQIEEAQKAGWSQRVLSSDAYMSGLKTAKRAVLKTMDTL